MVENRFNSCHKDNGALAKKLLFICKNSHRIHAVDLTDSKAPVSVAVPQGGLQRVSHIVKDVVYVAVNFLCLKLWYNTQCQQALRDFPLCFASTECLQNFWNPFTALPVLGSTRRTLNRTCRLKLVRIPSNTGYDTYCLTQRPTLPNGNLIALLNTESR